MSNADIRPMPADLKEQITSNRPPKKSVTLHTAVDGDISGIPRSHSYPDIEVSAPRPGPSSQDTHHDVQSATHQLLPSTDHSRPSSSRSEPLASSNKEPILRFKPGRSKSQGGFESTATEHHPPLINVHKPSITTSPSSSGSRPTSNRRFTKMMTSTRMTNRKDPNSYILDNQQALLCPPSIRSTKSASSYGDMSFVDVPRRLYHSTEQNLQNISSRVTILIVMVMVLLILVVVCGGLLMWKVVQLASQVNTGGVMSGYGTGPIPTGPTYPLDPSSVKDCSDIYSLGYTESGIYKIGSGGGTNTTVFCDMKTSGGGWLVLMRRVDNSVNFVREWQDYRQGFGKIDGEFWIGNEFMHLLTNGPRKYKLRVDLTEFHGESIWAEYTRFSVAPETDQYRLYVGNYTGSAGDSFAYHNGCRFSTMEVDNDFSEQNCAKIDGAPWWFRNCHHVFLTGPYGAYPTIDQDKGITWRVPWGLRVFAKFAEMKIKPVFPVHNQVAF